MVHSRKEGLVHSGLTASIPGGDEAGGAGHTAAVTPFTPGHLYFDDPTWEQKIALRGRKTVYGQPYVVAHVNRPGSARSDDDKRYARLFCAAPELLAALIDVLRALDVSRDGGEYPDFEAWEADARAAIAKAVGDVKRDADPIHRRDGDEVGVNQASLPSQSEVG